jgi:hypothetical protein
VHSRIFDGKTAWTFGATAVVYKSQYKIEKQISNDMLQVYFEKNDSVFSLD